MIDELKEKLKKCDNKDKLYRLRILKWFNFIARAKLQLSIINENRSLGNYTISLKEDLDISSLEEDKYKDANIMIVGRLNVINQLKLFIKLVKANNYDYCIKNHDLLFEAYADVFSGRLYERWGIKESDSVFKKSYFEVKRRLYLRSLGYEEVNDAKKKLAEQLATNFTAIERAEKETRKNEYQVNSDGSTSIASTLQQILYECREICPKGPRDAPDQFKTKGQKKPI